MTLYFLCALVFLQYVLVQSLIPGLTVKKLDKTLLARKRQDNMDMCRIFTEQNEKLHRNNRIPRIIKSYIKPSRLKRDVDMEAVIFTKNPSRSKRSIEPLPMNPEVNAEDARRVESIVNKLYDDLEEKGDKVTYRQMQTTIAVQATSNQSLRRFDFAPAMLTGDKDKPEDLLTDDLSDNDEFPSKARWKFGIVPYFIDPTTYDTHLSDSIISAFDYVEKATCIRLQKLREKPIDQASMEKVSWLYISNPTGIKQCVHSNENRVVKGVQLTVFGYDCMSLGDIVHEVMHILGFSHEHLRSDRDSHISILWDNIKPGYKKFFDLNVPKTTAYELESLPYDYSSVLHYPPRAFSRNGQITIMTESGIKIGQREGLSEVDVEKVALIYSNECVSRNREYLLQTCPTVVRSQTKPIEVTPEDIKDYFKDRIFPYGIINYQLRDKMEFTIEERANIQAVFEHIEHETCLRFKEVSSDDDSTDNDKQPLSNEQDSDTSTTERAFSEQTSPMDYNDINTAIGGTDDDINKNDNDINEEGAVQNEEAAVQNEEAAVQNEEAAVQNEEAAVQNEENPSLSDEATLPNEVSLVAESAEIVTDSVEESIVGKVPSLRQHKAYSEISYDERKEMMQNLKGYNLTAKKNLLRQAIANKWKKRFTRRVRRSISNTNAESKGPTRRHTNAPNLLLKRTEDPNCPCPSNKKESTLYIGAGCFNSVNDLLHFFVHVLGLDHQHNMHDRDNYLYIAWSNLTQDLKKEMEQKLPPAASLGFQYDYQSVMHYPWLQIKDGKTNVMYPIWNDGWAMGHWQGLSSTDVQKLNVLYSEQCAERMKYENT